LELVGEVELFQLMILDGLGLYHISTVPIILVDE